MIFQDSWIFAGERGFVRGSLEICGDRFDKVEFSSDVPEEVCTKAGEEECVSSEELLLLPGLIDIHSHGNSGYDFSDGDLEGLRCMGRYLAANGITSFLPTSMTLPYEKLDAAFRTALQYKETREENGARIPGIHMEGPFFSEKKKGAQNALYLRLPDAEAVEDLNRRCGGMIRIVDVAPELTGTEGFIKQIAGNKAQNCRVSIAHTAASYEETKAAFSAGASHVTHLFNAMPGIHHREPGVIGAAVETEDVTAELICDGHHVHPSIIRMAFKLFPGRICMISDALRCCGMPDGSYELGGQQVTLKDNVARLSDGTIAGAASNLFDDLRNVIRFGVPVHEAVMAATIVPARVIGCDRETGSIEEGKLADLIVCDKDLNLRQVYIGGKRIK